MMPKFDLMITEKEVYLVEGVEADTEYEAFEKALEMMEKDGKQTYHDDSDGDYEVVGEEE